MTGFDDPIALSRRAEEAATQYLVTRYSGPGNPMNAQILRLNGAVATKVPFAPRNAIMNSIHGLERAADVPALLEFYASTEQPCWVGVTAARGTPELMAALVDHGFRFDSDSAVLAAPAAHGVPAVPGPSGVTIEPVTRETLAPFLEVLNRGFGTPEHVLAGAVKNQQFWLDVPEWRLLLARVDGEPAGAAVLAVRDGIAYLAAGATLEGMRGRGVHSALVAARRRIARDEGCAWITGQARFGSTSHRNQQRAGLTLIDVRQTWMHPCGCREAL